MYLHPDVAHFARAFTLGGVLWKTKNAGRASRVDLFQVILRGVFGLHLLHTISASREPSPSLLTRRFAATIFERNNTETML